MEKVLLELPVIEVAYVDDFTKKTATYTTSSLKQALIFAFAYNANRLNCNGIKCFYEGRPAEIIPNEKPLSVVLGMECSYSYVYNKLKTNAKIQLPDGYLDKNAKYVYSERLNKFEFYCDGDVVLQDIIARRITEGSDEYNSSIKSAENPDFLYADKAFVLGNGGVIQSDCFFTLGEAMSEFRNHLDCYSFIKVLNLFYHTDGTVEISPDKLLYRSDCHMNPMEALLSSGNNETVKKLVNSGQQDFVFDKKYETIMPTPANSNFVTLLTLLRWR